MTRFLGQARGAATVAILTLTIAGCATGPGSSLQSGAAYSEFRPAGAGPFPTILFVPGCTGFSAPDYEQRAEQFRSRGFLVVFLDSLTPRHSRTCAEGVDKGVVARDILAALAHLRAQAHVDSGRIAAIGWSHGGGSLLMALSDMRPGTPGLSRAIAFYPSCGSLRPWAASVPTLVFLAGLDETTPPAVCREVFKQLPPGTPLTVETYPEARHAFDFASLPPMTRYQFGVIGHHPASARAAWEHVERFLGPQESPVRLFNEQHQKFRQALRSFVEKKVVPHVEAWEEAGEIPKAIWPRMGALGFLGVEYDEKYGGAGP